MATVQITSSSDTYTSDDGNELTVTVSSTEDAVLNSSYTGTTDFFGFDNIDSSNGTDIDETITVEFADSAGYGVTSFTYRASHLDTTETQYIVINGIDVAFSDDLRTYESASEITYDDDGGISNANTRISNEALAYYVFDLDYLEETYPDGDWSDGITSIEASASLQTTSETRFQLEVDFNDIALITCFSAGTLIQCRQGQVRVEDLTVQDEVKIHSGAFKKIQWVGRSKIGAEQIKRQPKLQPIKIEAGALGRNLPTRDLWVSRQHRMMVSSSVAERVTGSQDVLVAAIKLTELPGIYIDDTCQDVEYFHIALEGHEIVYADGAPAESFYLGQCAIKTVSKEARLELYEIFPELRHENFCQEKALPFPEAKQQKKIIARHAKNNKSILQSAVVE